MPFGATALDQLKLGNSNMAVIQATRKSTLFAFSVMMTVLSGGQMASAQSQVLYYEDFQDQTLAPNTTIVNGTIGGGFGTFEDPANARASFAVVQDLTAEVMTFSFDAVAPIVPSDPRMEVILRAGVGTAATTIQNADQVVEAIIFRTTARAPFTNSGKETVFLVANNKATDLVFNSPVDNMPVTLAGFSYVPYIMNRETNAFVQHKAPGAFSGGQRPFQRFAIGSSTTNDVGTFAIDNVLVVTGATFTRNLTVPGKPGDVNGDMVVDMADFDAIKNHFQQSATMRTDGDLTGDGFVDFRDYREWKSNVGMATAASAAVPEPVAGLLTTLAMLGGLAASRKRVR